MARTTLANSLNPHQSFAQTVRPFAVPSCPKRQSHFLVFPTGKLEYPWRITASATNRTISQHKSLVRALRKCTRLNEEHEEAPLDPLKNALSGFPDVNSYRAYYEGVGE
jgi:hypothetical protein